MVVPFLFLLIDLSLYESLAKVPKVAVENKK